jgi:hypothetical protein
MEESDSIQVHIDTGDTSTDYDSICTLLKKFTVDKT